MRVELITHETGNQIPILLDDDGFPTVLINEFILSRRYLSTNTLVRNTHELSILQGWLDKNYIDLIARLQSPIAFTEAELKGGLIETLRRERFSGGAINQVVSPNTFNLRLTTVRLFLAWCTDVAAGQLPSTSKVFDLIRENKKRILNYLDFSFQSVPTKHSSYSKGLKEQEIKFLLSILDPGSCSPLGHNTAVRYRNYISVAIMLFTGLRPGELLSLRVEDIKFGAISSLNVLRRPPDPNDTRRPRPQIKRNERILPIENKSLLKILDEYIMNWREVLYSRADKETDYLILSDEGRPLSLVSLAQFFRLLRNKFTSALPPNLTAKSLRHTFSSRLEKDLREAGIGEERRRKILAYARGDSSLDSQDIYIAQEIEEQASLSLTSFQKYLLK